ncbi:ABCG-like transporter [Tubulinosema ratisbonensis]|uniref:ABCG-like transporter n=1 Tax=Tubulinosema ratisbonensis TaxID=291195 RepID=A0A437AJB9_9MICR|nr:ABCG-like transporter [Tubulinosema ratisbonensis]
MDLRSQELELIYNNLTLENQNNKILDNVNGKIKPSSMTALLGTSGAGKTSLMNSLAGRIPPNLVLSGSVNVNGRPRNPNLWPEMIGYVEQELFAYDNQTVYETLSLVCKFKSASLSKVDRILDVLNLTPSKQRFMNELSGGERKRVSIGIELIGNPSILFLDEPTSGLDSFNAINILETLSKLKELGKSIVITIHQPSFKMLQYFDNVILMGKGAVIFDGKLQGCVDFFKENGYECPEYTNPTDYFLETISINTTSKELERDSLQRLAKLKEAWQNKKINYEITKNEEIRSKYKIINYTAFLPLLLRNFRALRRDTAYIKIEVIQKTVFFILIGCTFLQLDFTQQGVQSRAGVIIFIILNAMFGTCGPIFNLFAIEKKIITRERKSGFYDGFSAFTAKYVVQVISTAITGIYYITALYWMVGLNNNFAHFLKFLLVQISIMFFAAAFGLTVSAATPNQSVAQVVGTLIIIVFTVFGCFFSNPDTIPSWLRWLIWLSPVNYAFRASMQSIFHNQTFICENQNQGCLKTGQDVLDKYNINKVDAWACIFIIWGFTLFVIILGAFILHFSTMLQVSMEKKKKEEV